MDFLATIDAALTLEDTEKACEVEQNAGFQLESIQFGTVVKEGEVFLVNKAAFNIKTIGRLKNLSFVEVKGSDDPKAIKDTGKEEGWTFICDSQIYVEDQVTRVIVFGKKSF